VSSNTYSGSMSNNPFGAAAVSVIGGPMPSTTSTYDYAQSVYSQTSHTGSSEAYAAAQVAHQQYAFGHHANESIGVGSYGGAKYSIGEDEDDASIVGGNAAVGRAA